MKLWMLFCAFLFVDAAFYFTVPREIRTARENAWDIVPGGGIVIAYKHYSK